MNQIKISGIITRPIEFDYKYKHEKFYKFMLRSARKSGAVDTLPCCIPEHLIDKFSTGDAVSIVGEIRTRNYRENGKSHLEIKIFVKEIFDYEEEHDANEVELIGFIVKKPNHRNTPNGFNITDLLIAVNRTYDKSDYLPCIVWGRNADWAEDLSVGKEVMLYGRFQSREYQKVIDGVEETRTAYEVSGFYIGESEENENA